MKYKQMKLNLFTKAKNKRFDKKFIVKHFLIINYIFS